MIKVLEIKRTFSFKRNVPQDSSTYKKHQIMWSQCQICKMKSQIHIPWYKKVIWCKVETTDKKEELSFKSPFIENQNYYLSPTQIYYTICSDECLNLFLLAII